MTGRRLDVPGASLYHEVVGSGPVLLLIVGGSGDAGGFGALAGALAGRRTVVSYDRRGYSRSRATDAPPPGGRIGEDVADALALLDEYSPTQPAQVLGSSSGAIVGLHLLATHPDRVARLVAHEPPLVDLLPDAADLRGFLTQVRDVATSQGIQEGMRLFATRVDIPEPPEHVVRQLPPAVTEMLDRMAANRPLWVEHELVQYPTSMPDLQALQRHSDLVVPAYGEQSRGEFPGRAAAALAERLGVRPLVVPGNHVGFVEHPVQFAEVLLTVDM